MHISTIVRGVLVGASIGALAACGNDNAETGQSSKATNAKATTPDAIREAGTLKIVTRNAPTAYYIDRHQLAAGPEYDLAAAYANHLNVELEILTEPTVSGVIEALADGDAHLAAAGLTRLESRAERFDFGPTYREVTEQVVCRREGERARKRPQLTDVNIAVTEGSSYIQTLEAIKASEMPELEYEVIDVGTEQLLHRVWTKQIDCTVADSNLVAINRRYYPELVVEFDLSEPRELAWMLPKGSDAMIKDITKWMATEPAKATLASVDQRYYAPYQEFDFVDTRAFFRRVDERYPKYDQYFERAAEDFDLDEIILAAQSYQESHWDPTATSPTGVRGIMMLTQNTAQSLGVEDRLNPKQAIMGGAKYLSKLSGRFDDEATDLDRLFLALASYNVGRAHMHDAQKLARERGLNPLKWEDVRQVLPLLSDKSVYPSLKYGYARGHEPVRYVDRIQNYADLMTRDVEGD